MAEWCCSFSHYFSDNFYDFVLSQWTAAFGCLQMTESFRKLEIMYVNVVLVDEGNTL